MPDVYKELYDIQHNLEQHFHDMQDIEFTIQDGKLWMFAMPSCGQENRSCRSQYG